MRNHETFSECRTTTTSPSRPDWTNSRIVWKKGEWRSVCVTHTDRRSLAAVCTRVTLSANVLAIGFSSSTS